MIESLKDLTHNRSSYESLRPSRNPSMSHLPSHGHGHHGSHSHTAVDSTPAFSDSLATTKSAVLSNASAIYGSCRSLDIITYASTTSRQITAAIVEHNPTGRSYIHCCSAKEDTRLAAVEHLLVITEDIMHRLIGQEGITSSGWLPATPQSQHATTFNQNALNQNMHTSSQGNISNLMKVESASSQTSTPSVVPGERQMITGPPQHQSMGPLPMGPPPPREGSQGPPQQIMAPQPQSVAPQPTRTGKVQWLMGSEG
jgi:hypothetical protein